jgi:hypothetical protein|nr:MAG TPA: restriction alleviation protein [Caudoviricetes sp.]
MERLTHRYMDGTAWELTREEAIKNWNRRAQDA